MVRSCSARSQKPRSQLKAENPRFRFNFIEDNARPRNTRSNEQTEENWIVLRKISISSSVRFVRSLLSLTSFSYVCAFFAISSRNKSSERDESYAGRNFIKTRCLIDTRLFKIRSDPTILWNENKNHEKWFLQGFFQFYLITVSSFVEVIQFSINSKEI